MPAPSPVDIRQERFKGWNAYRIKRGPLVLSLVPQVGGRIMGMQWRGHELAFVNPELQGRTENLADGQDAYACKRELGFLLWGGDKTWLAPQDAWSYELPFLDLDSGAYRVDVERRDADGATVRMTSPVCRETGIQITRVLTADAGEDGWTVLHRLQNRAEHDTQWALWDVSMVRRPARVYLLIGRDSRYPDGVKTFANEGESAAIREKVVSRVGNSAVVTCTESRKFKFGVDAELASILAITEVDGARLVGYRKNVPTFHPQPYGHGCVAEVFNSSLYPYFEMEVHGPVVTLRPGEYFDLIERAILFDVPAWPESAKQIREYFGAVSEAESKTK